MSLRHNPGPDDSLLDAARASILAVGWKRTTLTDVARRAGVSRMTIYRRWSHTQGLLADLMTREWAAVIAESALPASSSPIDRLAQGVSRAVRALRENELFRKIVEVDPELLLPYLLERRGRTQDAVLAILEAGIVDGQKDGSVRSGDPTLMARSILLATYGFTFAAHTMTQPLSDLDAELRTLVERYLLP